MGRVHVLSRSLCLRQATAWMLIYCISFATPVSVALGGIENPKVISGQVAFQQSGGNTTITASDQSIINYSRFDIGAPETVQFIQPGSTASVLNRILSANPSRIDGTLLANGRVFFINPAGVIIGGSATINVNQLVASGLNMSDADFLSGRYQFAGGNGSVVNAGDISAQSVYLVGKEVINTGNIRCPSGYVVMAAGDTVFLGQPGSDIVVEVGTLGATEKLSAESASQIINEGQIEVGSGSVVLAAAGDIFSRPLLKNTGSISASVAEGDAGNVSLKASEGEIDNAGSISAKSDFGGGGTVVVEGDEVVNSGTIDVSGAQGGAVVLEGASRAGQFGLVNADGATGDGGSVEIRADEVVAIGADSLTTANAGQNGNGGDIIAYSPGTALFREGAQVEAKGGSESGDGGFFELSGKEYVEIAGGIDLTAANGQYGEFLIDPLNIKIDADGVLEEGGIAGGRWTPSFPNGGFSSLPIDRLEGYLGLGDVTISTSAPAPPGNTAIAGKPPTQDGWVVFDAGRAVRTTGDNPSSLRVDADAYIRLISGIDFRGSGDVILNAGSYVRIDAPVRLRGGAFVAKSGLSDVLNANIFANNSIIAGAILLDARRGDNSQVRTRNLTATSGNVEIYASDNTIHLDGNIDTDTFDAGDIILHNNTIAADGVLLDAGRDVVLAKDKTMTGLGALTIEAGDNISLGKDLAGESHSGGDVTTQGDMTMTAGNEIFAYGQLTSLNGSIDLSTSVSDDTINLYDDITASGNVLLRNNTVVKGEGVTLESVNSDVILARGKSLDSDFDLTVEAGQNIRLGTTPAGTNPLAGDVTTQGDMTMTAGNEISAGGKLTSINGSIDLSTSISDDTINLYDDVTASGNVLLRNNTVVKGEGVTLESVNSDVILARGKSLDSDFDLTVEAGRNIRLGTTPTGTNPLAGDVTTQGDMTMTAGNEISAGGKLTSINGSIDLSTSVSDDTINLYDDVTASGNVLLRNNTVVKGEGVTLESVNSDVILAGGKTLDSDFDLTIEAGRDIALGKNLKVAGHSGGDVTTRGDMTLTAGDDIEAYGDLTSVNGSVSLYSSDDTTHLGGNVTASTDVLLNNNTRFEGAGDQRVNARTGTLTANGSLEKTTNGSLYLHSSGDMSVADHLTAVSGGVSLVSDTGRIHSDGAGTLDVPITGSSDGTTGVDLPGGGKAAIVVISKQQDLNLGGNATLTANGVYDPTVYDDRASINFKNAGDNQGVPIDVAIYLASFDQATGTGASVNAGSPVNVASRGTMVIDAFDTVTFGNAPGLKDSLLNKTVDHLELCSRISTSLSDASINGRLPDLWVNYYTARGDSATAAPVLQIPVPPDPLPDEALGNRTPPSPPIGNGPQGGGSYVDDLMWLAMELGLCADPSSGENQGACRDALQAFLAQSFLQSTDVAPWDVASRLRQIADLLLGSGSEGIAALINVVNEFVDPSAPPSPEQFASIRQALADGGEGTYYAEAREWLNTLVQYVVILQEEFGWSADESIAFVMGKYGPSPSDPANATLLAFLQMQLAGVSI